MKKLSFIIIGLVFLGSGIIGCENATEPIAPTLDEELAKLEAQTCPTVSEPAPAPLVIVDLGTESHELWPYTGTNFSGQPQDPINLIFYGKADPRDIRAALLSLNGARGDTVFPPVSPFDLTWEDAIGDMQTAYGSPDGWSGSVIQLSCGDYSLPRFHIRLFQIGDWTVANAHFEILIPGTTDHQVLSWELAEQFVIFDFIRSGLLDPVLPMVPTGPINDSPFRTIPTFIYNELPVELRALIGGPLGDVSEDVGIPTDGNAIILNLASGVPWQPGTGHKDFIVEFGQVIPKPFCSSGPGDYLYVQGPVHMKQTVTLSPGGVFKMSFQAVGDLAVTPVNPLTGKPIGETMDAFAFQSHSGKMTNGSFSASGVLFQRLGDYTQPESGALFTRLIVRSNGHNGYQALTRCGSEPWGPVLSKRIPAGLLDAGDRVQMPGLK